ncbi:MAG: AbrB/MazE/SpoVT family DNA-binding domain-containing protein [Halofilum sp. (in: g-proteobacteria)]
MRVTSKGQVTIPLEIRQRLGIGPSSEVEFVAEDDKVVLRRASAEGVRGNQLVKRLRGRASVRMSTDEIMALTRRDD